MASYKDCQVYIFDDYITPKYVFEEIKQFIPKDKVISMPFYCEGSAGKYMRELGFNVIHTDEDFFKHDRGDIVVDNPPYNKKRQVLETLIKRDKPFMLLVPCSTLCYLYAKIIKGHVQIIVPVKKPKFIRYDTKTKQYEKDWQKKYPPFECLWVCWKMNLANDINFA